MPLLAALFASWSAFFANLVSSVMFYVFTTSWARRAFIVALGVAFFAAVSVCVSGLLSAASSVASVSGLFSSRFLMGLGMFIPSNAVAVLGCLGGVWLACVVYRLKLEALRF